MADIDVERKGPSIWPWIIGLIVLALLIWLLAEWLGGDDDVVVEEPVPAAVEPAAPGIAPAAPPEGIPAEVQSYLSDCTEEFGAPEGDMGLQHQFTVECLQKLRAGLNAVIVLDTVGGVDVQQQLDDYTAAVQQLQASDPSALTHANLTRDASTSAVALMEGMQRFYFAGEAAVSGAVGEARQAAQGIQGEVPMLEQRDSVHGFFREAGDALRAMAERFAVPAPA